MNRIRAVTFDAGGTLIDPWPSVGAVYARVAREHGWHCSEHALNARFAAVWRRRTGFGYSRPEWFEIVRECFADAGELSREIFEAIYTRFAERESWLIYDDVIPALQELESRGIRLAVLSNWDERLVPLLENLGLASYFEHIVASSALRAHKPDPAIFHHIADRLGLTPPEILHVGDSSREDIQGAREAGFSALRIRRAGATESHDIPRLTRIAGRLAESPVGTECG